MAYLGSRQKANAQRRSNTRQNVKPQSGSIKNWYSGIDWSRVRLGLIGFIFMSIWLCLWGRAAYLQLFDGGFLAERARRQHTSVETVTGQRGMILDRNGQILARSIESRSVYVKPREITDINHLVNSLSQILNMEAAQIERIVSRKSAFIWLARKVSDATAEAIRQADLPGVGMVKEYERLYPFKQVAGQLMGFTNVDGSGLEGLEKAFDDDLVGLSSRRTVRRDASGRRFYVGGGEISAGQNLDLTIDVQVQFLAEEALAQAVQAEDAKWGGALVVDVEKGEILAWAQYPFFNPNSYREYSAVQYRNRVALDALEPGSTLKPLVVAAALQEGLVSRDTQFDCENGYWATKRTVIRDDGRKYGKMSVEKILSLSSNIGFAKIGLTLGAPRFHRYLSQLGFGQRTNLHVAESKGILHKVRDWSETDTMSIGFGQGMATTVLQLTQAYLTLGNKGVYKPLKLVLSEQEEVDGGNQRIFSEKVSREVLDMMRDVIDTGTGKRSAIEGVIMAGKTGTAQKADKTGKYGQQRTASFVGFVPAENPRYLIVIMLDEPQKTKYGGIIAAPVFKNIVMRTLAYHGIPTDEPARGEKKEDKKEAKKIALAKAKAKKEAQQAGLKTGVAVLAPELVEGNSFEVRKELGEDIKIADDNVPDVVGKSLRRAVEMFAMRGIVPVVRGSGSVVIRQSPEAGDKWQEGTVEKECIIWISDSN